MMTATIEPRAWVGCLGCYNSGRLHGEWIDGTQASDPDEWRAAGLHCREARYQGVGGQDAGPTYTQCTRCGSDEWWVFDHEGYGGAIAGECSPVEAERLADLLVTVGDDQRPALAYWISEDRDPDDFEEAYAGEWDSFEAYAAELADGVGMFRDWPETAVRYFDMDAWARDLHHDYETVRIGGSLHVFRGGF